MKVKVVIYDGIVQDVLSDGEQVEIEIIDVDSDYEDHDELQEYAEQLYADPSFHHIDYSVAHFQDEDEVDGANELSIREVATERK